MVFSITCSQSKQNERSEKGKVNQLATNCGFNTGTFWHLDEYCLAKYTFIFTIDKDTQM